MLSNDMDLHVSTNSMDSHHQSLPKSSRTVLRIAMRKNRWSACGQEPELNVLYGGWYYSANPSNNAATVSLTLRGNTDSPYIMLVSMYS
jgi:hypothetical protein